MSDIRSETSENIVLFHFRSKLECVEIQEGTNLICRELRTTAKTEALERSREIANFYFSAAEPERDEDFKFNELVKGN